MMNQQLSLAAVLAIIVFSVVGADEPKPAPSGEPAEKKVTYEEHILPLFREKCGTCHNANDKKGGLVLDNYAAAMQGGASGESISRDGDVSSSFLFSVVAHETQPFMPPNQPRMPDAQLALIRTWIEQGALKNSDSKARTKKNVVAKVAVSTQRPEGPPPMPASGPVDVVLQTARGNGVTALAANPWSTLIAVSGHKQILLYDTKTLVLVGVLPFPEGIPHILKFSRNGQMLMAGGGRGALAGKVVLFDVKTGNRTAEIGAEYDIVLAADLSPDQTKVALGGPKKIVRCYDVASGELIYEKNKHTDWITSIEFSPDGILLATGDRSNGLIVWEAETGREFHVLNGHTGSINDVSWSADGNLLASGSSDGQIRLWEMNNGNSVRNWAAHGGGLEALDFTREGKIISTGRDRRVVLWDLAAKAEKVWTGLGDVGMEVAFNSDSQLAVAGDWTGNVLAWNLNGQQVGTLVTNPQPLAVRLEQGRAELKAAENALAAAQQQVANLERAVAVRAEAANNAQAALKKKTEEVQAAETASKQAAEAAAKDTENKDLAAAAQKAAEALKQVTMQRTQAEAAAKQTAAAAPVKPEEDKAIQAAKAAVNVANQKMIDAKAKADLLNGLMSRAQQASVKPMP